MLEDLPELEGGELQVVEPLKKAPARRIEQFLSGLSYGLAPWALISCAVVVGCLTLRFGMFDGLGSHPHDDASWDWTAFIIWHDFFFTIPQGLLNLLSRLTESTGAGAWFSSVGGSAAALGLSQEMVKWLGPALGFSLVAGIVASVAHVANSPKYLELKKNGIMVGNYGGTYAMFVPWKYLKKVSLVPTFDLTGRRKYMLVMRTDEGVVVDINLKDALECVESGTLFSALRTWAPRAIANMEVPKVDQKAIDATYTELWFKYFSRAAERGRMAELEPGAKLGEGRYEVVGRVGGGGQGNTYLATAGEECLAEMNLEPGLYSDVLLKEYVLPVHRSDAVLTHTTERLENEADILCSLDHPRIVKCLDCFVEDHRGYLVMEFVEGQSLKDLVVREGAQPEEFVRNLAEQMCDVLAYLHGLTPPVVHRDFTPDNLILQENGEIKLVDFNVAHQLDSGATATVVGKHAYIPPEQFRGRPCPQSDIYALGCTMHYLLTGQEPEPITPSHPRSERPETSEHMDAIVARATATDATRRYTSADELKGELERAQV